MGKTIGSRNISAKNPSHLVPLDQTIPKMVVLRSPWVNSTTNHLHLQNSRFSCNRVSKTRVFTYKSKKIIFFAWCCLLLHKNIWLAADQGYKIVANKTERMFSKSTKNLERGTILTQILSDQQHKHQWVWIFVLSALPHPFSTRHDYS